LIFFSGPPLPWFDRSVRRLGRGERSEVSTMGLLEKSVQGVGGEWMALPLTKRLSPSSLAS
jgi:hypothetical protein